MPKEKVPITPLGFDHAPIEHQLANKGLCSTSFLVLIPSVNVIEVSVCFNACKLINVDHAIVLAEVLWEKGVDRCCGFEHKLEWELQLLLFGAVLSVFCVV